MTDILKTFYPHSDELKIKREARIHMRLSKERWSKCNSVIKSLINDPNIRTKSNGMRILLLKFLNNMTPTNNSNICKNWVEVSDAVVSPEEKDQFLKKWDAFIDEELSSQACSLEVAEETP